MSTCKNKSNVPASAPHCKDINPNNAKSMIGIISNISSIVPLPFYSIGTGSFKNPSLICEASQNDRRVLAQWAHKFYHQWHLIQTFSTFHFRVDLFSIKKTNPSAAVTGGISPYAYFFAHAEVKFGNPSVAAIDILQPFSSDNECNFSLIAAWQCVYQMTKNHFNIFCHPSKLKRWETSLQPYHC